MSDWCFVQQNAVWGVPTSEGCKIERFDGKWKFKGIEGYFITTTIFSYNYPLGQCLKVVQRANWSDNWAKIVGTLIRISQYRNKKYEFLKGPSIDFFKNAKKWFNMGQIKAWKSNFACKITFGFPITARAAVCCIKP